MRDMTLCFLTKGHPPDEVLLGLKKVGFGKGKYAGFGGKVEDGETVESAAIREVEEEVGISLLANDLHRVAHLKFLFPAYPDWNQAVHVFMANTWRGEIGESDEMQPRWFSTSELPLTQMWQDAPY